MEVDDDPVLALEKELLKDEAQIFEATNICDIGDAKPLASNFGFEHWTMLALRFELHLLVHAFKRDSKSGTLVQDQVAFYYNKYYSKMLTPSNYGLQRIDDVLNLIDNTVVTVDRVVESQLTDELHSNDIFLRLAEDDRQVRQRRVDSGDTSAILRVVERPAAPRKVAPPQLASLPAPPPPPLTGHVRSLSLAPGSLAPNLPLGGAHAPLLVAPQFVMPPPPDQMAGGLQPIRGKMPPPPQQAAPQQAMGKGDFHDFHQMGTPYGAAKGGGKGNSTANPYADYHSWPNPPDRHGGSSRWS